MSPWSSEVSPQVAADVAACPDPGLIERKLDVDASVTKQLRRIAGRCVFGSRRTDALEPGGRLERHMKLRGWAAAVLIMGSAMPIALAQSGVGRPGGETYIPRLNDIMNLVQVEHAKLWYAGQARNWDLAAYELTQLRAGLADAAVFYTGLPVSNVTTLATPIGAISDAIAARDSKRFAGAVGELTAGCNSCHETMQRSFVVIRVPAEKPFGNQMFQPQIKR